MKTFSGFAQTASTYTAAEYVCSLCGEKFEPQLFQSPPKPHLCNKCEMKVKNKILELLVPADSKEHCPKCHYHVKACQCDEAIKMKELEK